MTSHIPPALNAAPLLGLDPPTLLSALQTQLPTCTCCTFFQFYLCGCPDLGLNPQGQPIPSIYRCPATYLPLTEQSLLSHLGFTHRTGAALPHNTTPRILPFPCYCHMQHARIHISPAELRANTLAALAAKRAHLAREKQVEREKSCHRAQTMARARLEAYARGEISSLFSSSFSDEAGGGEDPLDWVREEACVDLYTLDNGRDMRVDGRSGDLFGMGHARMLDRGNPWFPFHEQATHMGYVNGAWRVDANALNQARWRNFGVWQEWVERNARHAGNHPEDLHM